METLIQALKAINDVIWGPGMLILLIGTGLYLTVGLRFYTFRNIFSAFSMLWKGRTSSAGACTGHVPQYSCSGIGF